MERRGTAEMSFINGSLSEKTVICSNIKMKDRDRDAYQQQQQHCLSVAARRTIADDSNELSIFDAKKYFNELSANNNINKVSPITNMEQPPPETQRVRLDHDLILDHHHHHRNYKARSFNASTPTASSEASWNSQTGLLCNPPGAISVSVLRDNSDHLVRKTIRRSPSSSSSSAARWIFRSSKCPCTGKKSVEVQESKVIADPKISPPCLNNSNLKPEPELVRVQVQSQPDLIENSDDNKTVVNLESDNDVIWSQRLFNEQQLVSNNTNHPSTQVRFPPNLLLKGQTIQRVMASGRPFSVHHQNINSSTLPVSGNFTFPILKSNSSTNSNHKSELPFRMNSTITNHNNVLIEDSPRDSLEVFKPSSSDQIQMINFSPKSRILATAAASGAIANIISDIDDGASDASSDLFEIESFSTQSASTTTYPNPIMYHRRDSLEEARRLSMAPSDWYEPSEASIDWSVTTAEGFDRASLTNFSELDDFSGAIKRGEAEKGVITVNNNSRRRSSSGNGLLSCRSEKAVSVGPHPQPQPVKFISNAGGTGDICRSNGPSMAINNGIKHVGSRPPLGNKPPLARSKSQSQSHAQTRLSHTFAL